MNLMSPIFPEIQNIALQRDQYSDFWTMRRFFLPAQEKKKRKEKHIESVRAVTDSIRLTEPHIIIIYHFVRI